MIQEALLLLLIALILWPKPVLGAARWVMRHAFGSSGEDSVTAPDSDKPDGPDKE